MEFKFTSKEDILDFFESGWCLNCVNCDRTLRPMHFLPYIKIDYNGTQIYEFSQECISCLLNENVPCIFLTVSQEIDEETDVFIENYNETDSDNSSDSSNENGTVIYDNDDDDSLFYKSDSSDETYKRQLR